MERFYKRLSQSVESSSSPSKAPTTAALSPPSKMPPICGDSQVPLSNQDNLEFNLNNLLSDLGLRPSITSYPPKLIEQVRRAYLLKGPCQPREYDFPHTLDGNRKCKFIASWFDEFKDWVKYRIVKDVAYCLYCYLFFMGSSERGPDAFVMGGFNNWRKKERLRDHVGNHNSDHHKCRVACQNLMNQAQHIDVSISKATNQSKIDYRCRLNALIVCLCYLIMQGLPFRGNDESYESLNQGNFVELLKVLASCNEEIHNVVLGNAPENHKLTSLMIQKDIIRATSIETTNAIIEDLGHDFFSILVDECRDISVKEQMGVVIRYVNKSGCVIERFLGLVHFSDTTATSLEQGIWSLFSIYGLSISSLRGQCYDVVSNMKGEFNGLKSLILKKNSSAYYVHCFAHQLQLTLVSVAKKHTSVSYFFNTLTRLTNIVGGSCKRRDMLREKQKEKVIEGIASNEIETEKGLNQEMTVKRPGDTRWSSHYGTLINLVHLFPSNIDVLEYIGERGNDDSQRAEAIDLLEIVNMFNFVVYKLLYYRVPNRMIRSPGRSLEEGGSESRIGVDDTRKQDKS
ncbi:zinc finger MYM-type protein [Striga asiatica]|uniref:Zinc finger MYM-type protein n=1 Tax=Striga asiatica TaxID=4170 RepID=A0A5A7PN77_STRAF|nr:zinc finger MYM-type protein [Striga asiatica]